MEFEVLNSLKAGHETFGLGSKRRYGLGEKGQLAKTNFVTNF